MSRVCTVTGKKSIVGNKVSHSQVKTKRQFRPNLVNSSFWSDILNRNIKIKVSTSAIRTVEKHGGFVNVSPFRDFLSHCLLVDMDQFAFG